MKNIKNAIEIIMTIIVIITTVFMAVIVMKPTTNTVVETRQIEVSYKPQIQKNIRSLDTNENPENWIILEINEDYSMVKVLKSNGHIYWITVYEANDNTITIDVNGEYHDFYYTR